MGIVGTTATASRVRKWITRSKEKETGVSERAKIRTERSDSCSLCLIGR
ncbi:hypothetical protein [Aquimarina sp. TRL1]|nr:hypothetical protein [Aquimarina sp. TRL1]